MMDLTKSYDFFAPDQCQERLHIIGCGAVGSTVAELLVRLGLTKITLYDFDIVEPHNITNQMFRGIDIGKTKVEALESYLREINPDLGEDLRVEPEGYISQRLSGYVFLCVDNIDLRREIATKCKGNAFIKAFFDFRMRLTDGQHYAARWNDYAQVENFLETMNFTHEEAQAETPVSACNVQLSVAPTVRMLCNCGVANFMNFVKSKGADMKQVILMDAFRYQIQAF